MQLEKEIDKVKSLSDGERYCFRCNKDRVSIVGIGGEWFYNPIAQRSLCDTRGKDGYGTCKPTLEKGGCDECGTKLKKQEKFHESLNTTYHLDCWKIYAKKTELDKYDWNE